MQLDPNSKSKTARSKTTEDDFVDLSKAARQRFEGEIKLSEADKELRSVAQDLVQPTLFVAGFTALMAALSSQESVPAQLPLLLTFVAGYAAIVFEEAVQVDKTAVALAMGVACWLLVPHAAGMDMTQVLEEMGKAVNETSQIVFFFDGRNGYS